MPPPQPTVDQRAEVVNASVVVRRAARRRDAAARALRARPGMPCDTLFATHTGLDAAWDALEQAWRRVAPVSARQQVEARTAQAQIAVQRGLDARSHEAWRRWCGTRAPVGVATRPPPARARACGAHQAQGAVLGVAGEAPLRTAADTVALLRAVGPLAADWDLVFVVQQPSLGRVAAAAAHVAVDRRVPGLGRAPVDARHLPQPALEGAVVLSAADGLADGPTLREIVRVYGNRWVWPGCSPGPGGGWGLSDAGGQLGGGAPGGLVADGAGGFRWRGLAGQPSVLGNGGNTVPYAPIELYLLGLLPLESVRPVQVVREGRIEAGRVLGAGLCTLDAASVARRFGRRPAREAPWRVGLIVRGPRPPDSATLARWRARLWAFATPGPDANPLRFNFWEATGGRGRLVPTPASCDGAASPLP